MEPLVPIGTFTGPDVPEIEPGGELQVAHAMRDKYRLSGANT